MMRLPTDFVLEVHAATQTIDITGDLAGDEVAWVAAAVNQLCERSPHYVTIDGCGVDDVDAAGLDELATLAEQALRSGTRVEIRNPSPAFRQKLITGGCAFLIARSAAR